MVSTCLLSRWVVERRHFCVVEIDSGLHTLCLLHVVADFSGQDFSWEAGTHQNTKTLSSGCCTVLSSTAGLSNLAMNWMGGARKKNNALEKKREPEEARQRSVN